MGVFAARSAADPPEAGFFAFLAGRDAVGGVAREGLFEVLFEALLEGLAGRPGVGNSEGVGSPVLIEPVILSASPTWPHPFRHPSNPATGVAENSGQPSRERRPAGVVRRLLRR
jgi:hypothetical protein